MFRESALRCAMLKQQDKMFEKAGMILYHFFHHVKGECELLDFNSMVRKLLDVIGDNKSIDINK